MGKGMLEGLRDTFVLYQHKGNDLLDRALSGDKATLTGWKALLDDLKRERTVLENI